MRWLRVVVLLLLCGSTGALWGRFFGRAIPLLLSGGASQLYPADMGRAGFVGGFVGTVLGVALAIWIERWLRERTPDRLGR